jgi:hypothetical protein
MCTLLADFWLASTRRDALGSYRVPVYAMPILVHFQWCSAVAASDTEMAAFEREMEGLS